MNVVSASAVSNTGRHAYEVSGLDTAEDYDIALFPAENVSVDDDGVVTFTAVTTVTNNSGSVDRVGQRHAADAGR